MSAPPARLKRADSDYCYHSFYLQGDTSSATPTWTYFKLQLFETAAADSPADVIASAAMDLDKTFDHMRRKLKTGPDSDLAEVKCT